MLVLVNELPDLYNREIKIFESSINACLKNYSVDEIVGSIRNYKDVLDSESHFFSHEWTLSEFLSIKGGLDKFMDREKAFRNYRSSTNRYAIDNEPEVQKRTEEEERIWQERIRRGVFS